jgi:hypothetical protein
MKVLEAQMPLPSSRDRTVEAPTIEAEQDLRSSKIVDLSKLSGEGRAMVDWISCLSRGKHDFDEDGVCVDCDVKRTT